MLSTAISTVNCCRAPSYKQGADTTFYIFPAARSTKSIFLLSSVSCISPLCQRIAVRYFELDLRVTSLDNRETELDCKEGGEVWDMGFGYGIWLCCLLIKT